MSIQVDVYPLSQITLLAIRIAHPMCNFLHIFISEKRHANSHFLLTTKLLPHRPVHIIRVAQNNPDHLVRDIGHGVVTDQSQMHFCVSASLR